MANVDGDKYDVEMYYSIFIYPLDLSFCLPYGGAGALLPEGWLPWGCFHDKSLYNYIHNFIYLFIFYLLMRTMMVEFLEI